MDSQDKTVILPVGDDRPGEKVRGLMSWYCPGCKCWHGVYTVPSPGMPRPWGFDGNLTRPTITPSILVSTHETIEVSPARLLTDNYYPPEYKSQLTRCHSFVRNGQIQFLDDCSHELAGKTVNMIPVDET